MLTVGVPRKARPKGWCFRPTRTSVGGRSKTVSWPTGECANRFGPCIFICSLCGAIFGRRELIFRLGGHLRLLV